MILPPLSQSILRQQGFVVDAVPKHNPHCTAFMASNHIEIIYPVQDIDIVLPRNFQGEYECLVFRASSQRPEQALLWFLDGNILGETTHHHTVTAIPETGPHQLVVQDHDGNTARCRFTVHRMQNTQ
ncbi:hypothetical protein GF406_08200 [candidate division KSB1 bacterium]|nr:hypothetical protein [candidate division KSB1 bacterium]